MSDLPKFNSVVIPASTMSVALYSLSSITALLPFGLGFINRTTSDDSIAAIVGVAD